MFRLVRRVLTDNFVFCVASFNNRHGIAVKNEGCVPNGNLRNGAYPLAVAVRCGNGDCRNADCTFAAGDSYRVVFNGNFRNAFIGALRRDFSFATHAGQLCGNDRTRVADIRLFEHNFLFACHYAAACNERKHKRKREYRTQKSFCHGFPFRTFFAGSPMLPTCIYYSTCSVHC